MPSRNEHIYSTRVLPADLEEIRTCLKANEKNRATAPLALGLTQQYTFLAIQSSSGPELGKNRCAINTPWKRRSRNSCVA